MSLLDSVKLRKSTVTFSERGIETEDLNLLFEAARWAPSSNNQQPWRFIVGKKDEPEHYNRLLNCLNEGNKIWAGHAPVLVLTITEKTFDYKERENIYAWHDVGLATGNLLAQATSMGIFAHVMGGFDKVKAREFFQLPPRYEPVSVIALGYKGNIRDFAPELQERENKPRERKNINQLVFNGIFGKSLF
ncbi:MAG: nitroreductase family protein [Bacteroidales bacterium]|nr:nitroreductase family protein [Bacteroidales bacterium]